MSPHDDRSDNEPRVRLDELTAANRARARRYYRTWRSVSDRRKARYQTLLFAHNARAVELHGAP